MTQHEKIYEFAKDGGWHCQTEFWAVSHSPHKRRAEMSRSKKYEEYYIATCKKFNIDHFEERDCIHGVDRAKDYKISGWEWGGKIVNNELEQVATANTPESRKIMEDVMRTTINGVSVPVFVEKKEKKFKETNAPKNTLF